MIYCTQCGKEMDDGALFCIECGRRLIVDKPEEAQESEMSEPTQTEPEVFKTVEPVQASPPQTMQPCFEMGQAAAMSPYEHTLSEPTVHSKPDFGVKERLLRPLTRPGRTKRAYTFLNTGAGLILALVLLGAVAILGVITPTFVDYENLMSLMKQCGFFALLAIAVVLTVRAKGLDLSIGSAMGLSAVIIAQTMLLGGPLINGVLLAASAALVLGLVNGFAAVLLKAPVMIVTLATGVVASGISMALTQGQMLAVEFSDMVQTYAGTSPIGILILLGASFVFAYLYNLLTKTGRPLSAREKEHAPISYMFAYLAAAEIAAAAGFVMLVRFQTVTSALGADTLAYIIFAFALITASKALDNRFFPVLFALVPGVIWGALQNIFAIWGVIAFYQPIVYGGLALICLMLALLCRFERNMEKIIKN